MKIAFLILAHSDLDQLKRLCVKLVDYGHLYIHIDKKTDKDFVRLLSLYIDSIGLSGNVKIINNRVNVAWGGFSQVMALKNLMEVALDEKEPRYDRFFVISGLCYPLFSPPKMMSYCENNKNKEFMMAYNLSRGDDKIQKQRVALYHYFRDIPLPHKSVLRKAIIGGSKLLLKYLQIRKKPYLMINETRWDVYASSQWVGLTGNCCRYVLDQLNNNHNIARYFKTSYAPDEMVIATLIMNSDYREKAFHVDSYDFEKFSMLHYLHYTDHIWTYDEKDYEAMMESGKPFVRKLVSGKSEKLIEAINKYHNKK
jgi:hypothetical protein